MAWAQLGAGHGEARVAADHWSRRALIPSVKQAAAAIEPGTPAQPFINVLTELVQERPAPM
ncbi:hypothetical protein GCM10023084_80240 [Streptomyces lacrimifluminis]|uniref:Uncharacterized protein n=1 Tax=Streptomyces lacrimifluminis TaxID=1500077 RepID=A0A917PCN9_9ACTN|nr:hypothetical protein GCM10012282_79630 [Streptomyces lacrimifluminis]